MYFIITTSSSIVPFLPINFRLSYGKHIFSDLCVLDNKILDLEHNEHSSLKSNEISVRVNKSSIPRRDANFGWIKKTALADLKWGFATSRQFFGLINIVLSVDMT